LICGIFLLQPQQNFPILPQFFELIEITLVGGEEMHDYVAIIYDYPAVAGEALQFAFFLMLGADVFNGGFGERVYHAVAAAVADDEIIGK
jgi:hypothetical protein